ncbi:hypothetical protein A9R05_04910 [Burkholderia sp. KK1]|nr:hypothetical protein A9R05_04910 [Burkholderia sp. KK1]
MSKRHSFQCPYCNCHATLGAEDISRREHVLAVPNARGRLMLGTAFIVCPNEACKQPVLRTLLWKVERVKDAQGDYSEKVVGSEPIEKWELMPRGTAKPFPDYIPQQLRDDYKEACLIADLSPKAAATLCRRCLQGMIRDFWKVDTKSDRLWDEMKAIKDKLDPETWESIVAVKDMGNIGAHMEKTDVNVIVDVESREAKLLIELIESLFEDWYVDRENRRKRHAELKDAAAGKKALPSIPAGK